VAAWSSFRDPNTKRLSAQQTAILSRNRAYISWSEPWTNNGTAGVPGGFAFAAIKIGEQRAGFFSVQMGANALVGTAGRSEAQQRAREESSRQLLSEIASLGSWTTNRVDTAVAAGNFNTSADELMLSEERTLALLGQAGMQNTFWGLAPGKRVTLPGSSSRSEATADYIFSKNAKTEDTPEISPVALTEHYPVTCDLDIEPGPIAPVPMPPSPPIVQAQAAPAVIPPSEAQTKWRIAGVVAGAIFLLACILKFARRRPVELKPTRMLAVKPAQMMIPGHGAAERIVIAPQSADTTGSATDSPPIVHIELPGVGDAESWQRRARGTERIDDASRHGLMVHLREWLKLKIVQRLAFDRAQLMDAQRKAAAKMLLVDERLAKIEGQLHERNRIYEQRISELEKELTEAREENRELIRAKIAQVKADMERERAQAERRAKEQS